MNIQPDVCIVIPTFNRKKQLCLLLTQLMQQKVNNIVYKIVVVVDGSTDGTYEVLSSEFPAVDVVKGDGNWWFTRSMNEGCKYAVNHLNPKLILTLNDDVQVPDNFLSEMLRNYYQSEENSIIGASSYSLSKPTMITFGGIERKNPITLKYYKYIAPYTPMEPGKLKGLKPSVTLPTRGMLISTYLIKKLNYLEEELFPQYSSDYDLVLRGSRLGYKVYISYDAYVYEDMDLTSSGNARLSKSFKDYIKNIFTNKYSSSYFFKDVHMAWRFGIKPLFPLYFLLILATVPYVYLKYKYKLKGLKENK
jgi:GT2 family glycosyltransferase